MRQTRQLPAILAMLALASVASSADEQTPSTKTSVGTQVVTQRHSSDANTVTDGTVALPADALVALDQMAQRHPELKAAIESAKAAVARTTTLPHAPELSTVAVPAELQAQWDDLLRKHPQLKDAFAGKQRSNPQSGSSSSSHGTVIINGKVLYSGPATSVSATSTNDGGKEHHQVVVDGKVVNDF